MPKRKIIALLCNLYCLSAFAAYESGAPRDDMMEHYDPSLESKTAHEKDAPTPEGETKEAIPPKPAAPAVPEGAVHVPYIPEPVKEQLKREIESEMREKLIEDIIRRGRKDRWGISDSWPEWVRRMTWTGDIRLRGQADRFADDNLAYNDIQKINDTGRTQFLNTTEDRERLRTRFRLGARVNIDEEWDVGFRVATGSASDPVSTNVTIGNTGRPYTINLDRAFLRFKTRSDSFTWWGGRMPNPFFATDLVWDEDLAFDGLALKWRPLMRIEDNGYRTFDPFLTLGAFPLQEVELSSKDKWLLGAQVGVNWRLKNSRVSFGLAYYDYRNIEGQRNTLDSSLLDYTAPQFVQKGNTVFSITDSLNNTSCAVGTFCRFGLASDYNELNATFSLAMYHFAPTQVILTADYVKNTAWSREKALEKITSGGTLYQFPLEDDDHGWHVRLTVGRPVVMQRGDWQVVGGYKYLGRDAVLDAFTDSDFHLGGTDAKGWYAGGSYAVADNVWYQLRFISTSEISGPPLNIDTLQLDLNARF